MMELLIFPLERIECLTSYPGEYLCPSGGLWGWGSILLDFQFAALLEMGEIIAFAVAVPSPGLSLVPFVLLFRN